MFSVAGLQNTRKKRGPLNDAIKRILGLMF